MDCFIASASETGSLDDIAQTVQETGKGTNIRTRAGVRAGTKGVKGNGVEEKTKKSPYKSFKDQLRKRVLGQVKTKIARTQILQKCTETENIEKEREWFTKRFPKVDWPLMKALCEKKKEDFHSSIEKKWSDMRISRALMSANPDQSETGRPNLSFPLSHEVSDFGSMPKLTEEEQQKAKQRWAECLSKVPLDKLSPEQLKTQFLEGKALRQASTKDLQEMRKATWELNKESQDRYRKHIDEMPLMGYMQTGDPSNEGDMDQAFSKYMGHLNDLLEKVEAEDVDMALLLRFEPLVEGLLKDNEGYCLVAEGSRLKSERDDSLKKWGLVTAGVVAAVPCFMTAGAVCLGLGALVGAIGYREAKGEVKESLERFLTGREFETMASLAEKDSAAFWELALLPTAAWGTTAGTALTIKNLFKKGVSVGKQSSSPSGTSALTRSSARSGNVAPSITTGIESYEDTLGRLATSSLGTDSLAPQQIKALEDYYNVVRGEMGPDGTFARAGNYTLGQRRKIIRYLESQGFSREQVRTLIEDGVVEINRSMVRADTRRVIQKLREGRPVFGTTDTSISSGVNPFKITELLEETDHGLLVAVERLDFQSGQLLKEKKFITDKFSPFRSFIDTRMTDNMRVLAKTDRGFIIEVKGVDGTNSGVFVSFEEAIKNGLLPKKPTAKDYRELEDVLNNYISGKQDQTGQFIAALDNSLIKPNNQVRLDNPESEAIFSAISSTRKKISSDELNLPSPIKMEDELAKQGYKAGYTAGLDQVNEWAAVRRRLQELNVNPRTTHIEYFADQIPDHIAHIRRGLEDNYQPIRSIYGSKLEQLEQLKELEEEAAEAISKQRVTYQWWLEFNEKLSIVMSGLHPSSVTVKEFTGLSYFPLKGIVPTVRGGDIGIMAFNRAGYEGVYPVGLTDKQIAKADGSDLHAVYYLHHDTNHARFAGNRLFSAGYSAGHKLFHGRLLKNMEKLPPEKRKKVEAVYFLMTHENVSTDISFSGWVPEKTRNDVIAKIENNVSGVFKFPDDPAQKKQKIEDLADTFMEVYNRAQQHL